MSDEHNDVIVRQAKLLLLVMKEAPGASNKLLYSMFRDMGGDAPWKMFRRAVAITRGGAERLAVLEEQARIEEDKEVRALRVLTKEQVKKQEKKEEAEMTTIRREDLRSGQKVWVKVRYGNEALKLRPAKINTVMRAAVNVQLQDEKEPRTVRFNEIELTDGTQPAPAPPMPGAPGLSAVPPAFASLRSGTHEVPVEHRRPAPQDTRKPPEDAALKENLARVGREPEPAKRTEDALGQVNAWIEQGSSMRDGLARQRETIQSALDDLAAEALRVEEAMVAKRAELSRLESLLAALDQMRAVVAA